MKPVRIPCSYPAKWMEIQAILVYLIPLPLVVLGGVWNAPGWMYFVLVLIWLAVFCGLATIPLICDYVAFPEGIQIRVCGKVLRQISVSEIKLLCVVGDDRSCNLCLSEWDLDELAKRREEALQKGYFSRQDLPFLKKRPGWQERFAKEYLLKPKWRRSELRKLILLPVDPVVMVYLRRLYPQLECVDLWGKLGPYISMVPKDHIPYYTERYRVDEEGIHILRGNQELRLFQMNTIQTVLRIDQFDSGQRSAARHSLYLVVSSCSVKELAARGRQRGWQKWKREIIDQLPEAEEMYATEFYFSGFFTWNWRTTTDCHIWYTPEAEAMLRKLCPDAQWVDYSGEWF